MVELSSGVLKYLPQMEQFKNLRPNVFCPSINFSAICHPIKGRRRRL